MSASPANLLTFAVSASGVTTRRRYITPPTGRALEKLGHAIEYLSAVMDDDHEDPVHHEANLDALQLLMALNLRIYFECPEIPTLRDRVTAIWRRAA
jgi:hypothetical protein